MIRPPPRSPLFPSRRSSDLYYGFNLPPVQSALLLIVAIILAFLVGDRKSTRLNSNHNSISYYLFFVFFNDTATTEISPLPLTTLFRSVLRLQLAARAKRAAPHRRNNTRFSRR